MSLLTKQFPVCSGAAFPAAPPWSIDPDNGSQFVWRKTFNFLPKNGEMLRRPGLAQYEFVQPPWAISSVTTEDDCILWARAFVMQTPGALGYRVVQLVLTSRHIFVYNGSAWTNATPTYSDGTVTATNGSPTVTGSSTLWSTRKITAGQHITIDGVTYKIQAVGGETSITLTTNFTGATAAGKAYTIIRSFWAPSSQWRLAPMNEFFATIHNNTLYVAGTFLGSGDGSTKQTAVIKVTDWTGTPTSSYLTSNVALTATLDLVADLTRIIGIKVLQDGRVILAGNDATIFYSSHLDDTVWTVSPAGRTEVAEVDGQISALGALSGVLTIHSFTGIVIAQPTGLQDPPLRYQRAPVDKGCGIASTLVTAEQREWFVSPDLEVVRFDLSSVQQVTHGEIPILATADFNLSTNGKDVHAGWSATRHQYWLSNTAGRVFVVEESGAVFDCQFGADITAFGKTEYAIPSSTPVGANDLYAGTACRSLAGTELTDVLYAIKHDGLTDGDVGIHGSNDGFFVETDGLTFGKLLTYKTVQRVIVGLQRKKASTAQNFTVSVSADNGTTWVTSSTLTLAGSTNLTDVVAIQASFDELSPGVSLAPRARINFAADTSMVVGLVFLIVICIEGASIEGTVL